MNALDPFQVWRNVYQEVRQLSDAIESLPDKCECGDADAHLEGRCHCCGRHDPSQTNHVSAGNCKEILARLHADIKMLCKDFSVVAEPIDVAAFTKQRFELREDLLLTVEDLQKLLQAFERVSGAVAGFRRSCALSEMHRVKRHCVEMREHCERVNAELLAR